MNVRELKAKLADLDDALDVTIDAKDIKLGNLGLNPGTFYATDAKVVAAFGFGRVVAITATVN